jgi:hypothetical protein
MDSNRIIIYILAVICLSHIFHDNNVISDILYSYATPSEK